MKIPLFLKKGKMEVFRCCQYISCELAVLIIMLSVFSIMRDFYDGSYDAKRKTNIVDKKAKKKKKQTAITHCPTRSYM